MKKIFFAILLLAFTLGPRTRAQEFPFGSEAREKYLTSALLALKEVPPVTVRQFDQFVDSAEKHNCRSFFNTLRLNCLRKQVQNHCQNGPGRLIKNCLVVADLALVNKLNEAQFLNRKERFEISQAEGNYAENFSRGLNRKYAMLAAEMLLRSKVKCSNSDTSCLARQINEYCLKNANGHELPWQACASSIIWFAGTN